MVTTVVDTSFFSKQNDGIELEAGFQVKQKLPKMLPGQKAVEALKVTETTITNATGTVVAV